MRSDKYNIEISEDEKGNVCIEGTCGDLLELIHTIMQSITERKNTKMVMENKTILIKNKGENED